MELVRLADGSEVLVRPVRPDDKPLFAAAWERLGARSRYRRFLVPKAHLTLGDLAYFTEVDHVDHEAIGAIDPETGEGLGVARYVRLPGRPDTAEAAVTVIDAWQGRGLGGVLLSRLCERAAENGIDTFTATLLVENRRMLHLFERIGDVRVRGHEGAALEIDVALRVRDAATLRTALRNAATGHVAVGSRG